MKNFYFWIIISSTILLAHCKSEIPDPVTPTANTTVGISFNHLVNGLDVQLDSLMYQNANGDTFSIRTIKYFISSITFHRQGLSDIVLDDIHYVDQSITNSLDYICGNKIPSGSYTGISFTIGLKNAQNISNQFTSGPEFQMFWPENMGGGYHYQKLEGRYLDQGIKKFFNFHAGGLDNVDYSISMTLPQSGFTTQTNSVHIQLDAEIQNWFNDPVIWDFSYFGAAIMQNHEAQQTIQKNGWNVFSAIVTS